MQTSHEKTSRPAVRKNSTPQSPLLEIQREFNVPVSRLFQAFTTAQALKAWWWPKGLHSDRIDLDFREGGRYFINMRGSKGSDEGGGGMTGAFEEIVDNVEGARAAGLQAIHHQTNEQTLRELTNLGVAPI